MRFDTDAADDLLNRIFPERSSTLTFAQREFLEMVIHQGQSLLLETSSLQDLEASEILLASLAHRETSYHTLYVTTPLRLRRIQSFVSRAARAGMQAIVLDAAHSIEQLMTGQLPNRPHFLVIDIDRFLKVATTEVLQKHFSCLMFDHIDHWVDDTGAKAFVPQIAKKVDELNKLRVVGCGRTMNRWQLASIEHCFRRDDICLMRA